MQDPVTIKEKVRGSDLGRVWGVKGAARLLRGGGISSALGNELKVLERTVRAEERW